MEDWEIVTEEDYKMLPKCSGAYAFIVDEQVAYIGRTKCLWQRLRRHKTLQQIRDELGAVVIKIMRGWEAYDNERELVLEYRPRYNVEYLSKYGT